MLKIISSLIFISLMANAAEKEAPKKTGSITINSSINTEFVITDSSGKKTGRDPFANKNFNEIPGASYDVEAGIGDADLSDGTDDSTEGQRYFQDMEAPLETTYSVEIFSEKGGSYEFNAYLWGSNGNSVGVESKSGKLPPKGKVSLKFKYSEKSEK